MASARHEQLCEVMEKEHGYSRRGFAKAVMAAVLKEDEYTDLEPWQVRGVVPDAYRIDPEKKLVECVEVTVTNPVTDGKLRAYTNMWFSLDCEMWSLQLVVVDKYGVARTYMDDDHFADLWVRFFCWDTTTAEEALKP